MRADAGGNARLPGTLTEPGKESPYRNRSVEENLDLFMRMSKGEFPGGQQKGRRAKIDMSSPNLNMRDPIIYRIMYAHHHRTGDKWSVPYPMYDFAHPLSDREGVTHSLCSPELKPPPAVQLVCGRADRRAKAPPDSSLPGRT